MFNSFRSRLVISNLLITLAGLLVVGVVFTGLLSDRNRSIKENDLAAGARLIATQVEDVYRRNPRDFATELKGIVNTASRTLKVRVILANPHGLIGKYDSAHTTPYDTGSWHPLDQKALKQQQAATAELQSSNLVLFQSPIHGVHANAGAVVLVANVSDVQPGLSSLSGAILVILATLLLVWLAIGFYFTFSMSRPLLRIIGATRRMARGDYTVRVPAKGGGEIARLATDFNTMAQQVQQSDRVLKDFVANVSHDLRTPLTLISGFSEAILDGTAPREKLEDSAQIIHDEATRMQRMVEDLLQLTRLESGLQKFRREPVEVRSLVQHVIDRTVRAHGEKEVAPVRNMVPAAMPMIEVDREHIERALRNLLNNALQYTPAAGRVTVGAEAIGKGWVEIRVSDTGTGIPQQDLPRVFERFYRTDKSREREQGHSGLGLAIVREIVEAHGGYVAVESQEGEGTTFRFTAPQTRAPEPEKSATAASESVQPKLESGKPAATQ